MGHSRDKKHVGRFCKKGKTLSVVFWSFFIVGIFLLLTGCKTPPPQTDLTPNGFKTNSRLAEEDALYRSLRLENSVGPSENIEWSISYAYNTADSKNPRLLFIGDSICNMYIGLVRTEFKDKANFSHYVTSQCVTGSDYFRELSLRLHARKADVIFFNNGLHSLYTPVGEYEKCYRAAVKLIKASQPNAKILLILSTPLKNPNLTDRAKRLNEVVKKIAKEENLEIMDLFTPMDALDRNSYWADTFHFKADGQILLKKIISSRISDILSATHPDSHVETVESETGPSGKIR